MISKIIWRIIFSRIVVSDHVARLNFITVKFEVHFFLQLSRSLAKSFRLLCSNFGVKIKINWCFSMRNRKAETYQPRSRKFVIIISCDFCHKNVDHAQDSLSISQKFHPHRFLSFKTFLPKSSFFRGKWSFLRLKVQVS